MTGARPDPFLGANGDELTLAEVRAIQALHRVERRWPKTLQLLVMDGEVFVMRTGDERIHEHFAEERAAVVLDTFTGFPADGGAW